MVIIRANILSAWVFVRTTLPCSYNLILIVKIERKNLDLEDNTQPNQLIFI
jgi:hypothetical protein